MGHQGAPGDYDSLDSSSHYAQATWDLGVHRGLKAWSHSWSYPSSVVAWRAGSLDHPRLVLDLAQNQKETGSVGPVAVCRSLDRRYTGYTYQVGTEVHLGHGVPAADH